MPWRIGTVATPLGTASMTGLAFDTATNKLYASRDLLSSGNVEGIYEVNPTNAQATLVFATNTALRWGGFDYDISTNKLYALSDEGTQGLYEINIGAQTTTFVTPYPVNNTSGDIDGMAVGNGRAYMVEDRAVQIGVAV